MKPNYKNWVPKGMLAGYLAGAIICLIAAVVFGSIGFTQWTTWAIVLFSVSGLGAFSFSVIGAFMLYMHNAFSYDGSRQLSRIIIEGVAKYVRIPDGGKCLDVGCGSGALTIAVAKRNRKATVVGLDRWGKEYASFSRKLCEDNAKAEGVNNVSFCQGDATCLPFEDESFDAVTSNYVYHNIPSKDRQAILLETLRLVKKGGVFAIHDLFTQNKYGDMLSFVEKLKSMGYEKVELIDTTKDKFMTEKEAKKLFLTGSAILCGRK